jgi:hypothetical protein
MLPSESHTKILEGRTDTHLVMLDFLQTHRDNRDHDTLCLSHSKQHGILRRPLARPDTTPFTWPRCERVPAALEGRALRSEPSGDQQIAQFQAST